MARYRRPRFFWEKGNGGNGNGNGKKARLTRKTLFEPIEPRFLLSADITTPGVKDALVADLGAIKTVITSALGDTSFQNDAAAAVPLLNQVNPNPNNPPPGPPKLSDALSADLGAGVKDFATLFQDQLITPLSNHGAFTDNTDLQNFLNSLGFQDGVSTLFPSLNDALISVNSISHTDNTTAPITISNTVDGSGNGHIITQVTNSTEFDIDLTFKVAQTRTDNLKLDLGKEASLLGFAIDPTKGEGVDLHLDEVGEFNFVFGVIWSQKVDTDTTYIGNVAQPSPVITNETAHTDPFLKPSASGYGLDLKDNILDSSDNLIHNNDLSFNLRLGFIQVHANNSGNLTVDPQVHMAFTDPDLDGFIYLDGAQTKTTETAGLSESHSTGDIHATFNISGSFGSFNSSGSITLGGNTFSFLPTAGAVQPLATEFDQRTSPTVTATSLNDLLAFSNLTPDTAAGMLEALGGTTVLDASHNPLPDPSGGWLNNLLTSSSGGTFDFLDFHIPFADGTTLANVLNFAEAFEQKVINFGNSGLLNKDATNNIITNFISVQDLNSKLNAESILQSASYDSSTEALTFHIKLDYDLADQSVPISFNMSLDGLGGINASGTVSLNNLSASLDLTFGFDLHAPDQVKLTAGLKSDGNDPPNYIPYTPANGVLSGTADFYLDIGQGSTIQTIHVTVAPDNTNANIGDLVSDIQDAIDAANSTGITITVANELGRISLTAGNVSVLRVRAAADNTAVTELGFEHDPVSREPATLAQANKRFFVEPGTDVLKGEAKLSATGITASANFGFLSIGTSGGTASLTGDISMGLTDPGTTAADGRIDLNELFNALSNPADLGNLISSPSITGSADVKLNHLQATPDVFNLNAALGSGSLIHITSSDLKSFTVDAPSQLLDFKQLNFDDIKGVIGAIETFVGGLSADFSKIDQALEFVGVKLEDVLSFADKLSNMVADFTSNPASAVQVLQQHLYEALGISQVQYPDAVKLQYHPGDALQLTFTLTDGYSKTLPLSFDLGGGLKLGGNANLAFSADATAILDFGVSLSNPLNTYIYDDTGLTFDAKLVGQNLNFTAAIGPVGLFIKGGTAALNKDGNPNTTDPVTLKLGLDPDGSDHRYDTLDAINHLATPALTGAAHLELPIYFPTTSNFLTDFDFKIADLNHPENAVFTPSLSDLSSTLANLVSQFTNILDALPLMVGGLDTLLGGLQDLLNLKVFDPPIPLVGDNLTEAAQFIENFRENVVSKVRDVLDSGPALAAEAVKDAIYDVLGPSGAGIIEDAYNTQGDKTPDGQVTLDDIHLDLTSDQIEYDMKLGQPYTMTLPTGFDIGVPGLNLKASGGIDVSLDWSLDFGFGVNLTDGFFFVEPTDPMHIGLKIDPTPGFSVGGSLTLLSLQVTDNTGTGKAENNGKTEISGGFDVTLNGFTDGKLTLANLGDLGVQSATFNADAHADLDLVAGFGTQGVNTAFPSIEVTNFILDWHFNNADTTDKANWGSDANGGTPTVKFDGIRIDMGTFISDFLQPIFKKVSDIGDTIEPVLKILTYPIPVISQLMGQDVDLITIGQDLGFVPPGTDDIAKFLKDFIDISDKFATLSPGGQIFLPLGNFDISDPSLVSGTDSTQLIDKMSNISFDPSLTGLPSWNGTSFNVQDLMGSIGGLFGGSVASFMTDVTNFIESGLTLNTTIAGRPKVNEFTLDFPLWENPGQVFKLLLGQGKDIVVVSAVLPTLGIDYRYEQFFPIWDGLGVKIEGDIGAHLNLGFGYDLSGLIQFADSGFRLDALHDILYGFYIDTTFGTKFNTPPGTLDPGSPPTADNPITPLADLEFGIGAAAELNAVVASAGVEGKIQAELDLFAHDPDADGRFHLNEIISDLEIGYEVLHAAGLPSFLAGLGAPLGLFDFHGDVEVKLFAYVEALWGAWRKEFNITPPATLLDFTFSIADLEGPVLAEGHTVNTGSDPNPLGPGYLRLNMGPYAGNRVNGDTTDGDETAIIKHISGVYGDETIEVDDGAGHSQTFDHVKTIIIDAGMGNDSITFQDGVLADASIMGGVGDDHIDLTGFYGHATVHGGAGNDTIIGGGDPGSGNPVGEWLYGDDGSDTITGGPGPDTIIAGTGDDSVMGGAGNDVILGDEGLVDAVTLTGGNGNDTISGGAGDDLIYGGDGNDVLNGDAGKDTIYGGNGDDTVHGGTGNDLIYGEAGRDVLYGDENDDVIIGGVDSDVIIGGNDTGGADGNDYLFGDDANVTIDSDGHVTGFTLLGGNGNDVILGDDGIVDLTGSYPKVTLLGGGGNDTAYGEDGADLIYGDSGNDSLYGNRDDDTVFGNADDDYIDGGTGNDVLFGDNGQVTYVNSQIALFNQQLKTADPSVTGNDEIHGGSGDDIIFGGPLNDKATGDEGSDVIFGDMGQVDFDWTINTGSLLKTIKTIDFQTGGNDTLSGGAHNDIIFGGDAADTIYGDHDLADVAVATPGNDILIGDQGEVDFDTSVKPSQIKEIFTTDTVAADGGVDIINGNEGDDIALGGVAGDTIKGDGTDILVGDEGLLRYDVAPGESIKILPYINQTVPASVGDNNLATLDLVLSKPFAPDDVTILGGADTISGGPGTDIVMGGVAGDTIYGDNDTASSGSADLGDILLGDNGVIFLAGGYTGTLVFQGSAVANIQTTDTAENTGGVDTISGNAGADIILGGVAGDTLYGDRATPDATTIGNDGDDVILGDNGLVDFKSADTDMNTPKTLILVQSFTDGLGGVDTISGNAGNDVGIGGTAGDTMYGDDASASAAAADGEDILLGDNAEIDLSGSAGGRLVILGSSVQKIFTTDQVEATGGADTISGNAMSDVILGGVNGDTLYGDAATPVPALDGNDVILGDNGILDFTLDSDLTTLDLVQSKPYSTDGFNTLLGGADTISGNAGADMAMGGVAGDTIYGDDASASAGAQDGRDILLGDNGRIDLVGKVGELHILGSAVKTIETTDTIAATGGQDTISGNAADDIIAGGVQGDLLYGDAASPGANDGDDYILGDNARFEWGYPGDSNFASIENQLNKPFNNGQDHFDPSLNTLDLVTTELPAAHPGGRDTIYGDAGSDVIFGGEDADLIHGDAGTDTGQAGAFNDVIFGDHGRIYPQNNTLEGLLPFMSQNFFSIDTGDNANGEGDQIFGEQGDDIAIGGQGDDRIFGQSGNDDLIGGHNVPGGIDELSARAINASGNMNDIIDGGSGDDAILGDNGTIWRKTNLTDPRFQNLKRTLMYQAYPSTALMETDPAYGSPDVTGIAQPNPGSALSFGRDITLLDHDFTTQLLDNTVPRPFGNDYLAGGAGNDEMWGELGNDLMQGDGSIDIAANTIGGNIDDQILVTDSGSPNTGQTLHFNIYERTNANPTQSDGDDYMEGNGGADLMYGGLGQDDMIGGSSDLFGLSTPEQRPDMGDTIFGGAGGRIDRNYDVPANDPTIASDKLHARDADVIVGDNGDIYRLVGTNGQYSGNFLTFNYDTDGGTGAGFFAGYGSLKLIPRAVQYLDYVRNVGDAEVVNGQPVPSTGHGGDDIIHGEAGDDIIHGMMGNDVLYGDSQDDDIIGGMGNDWISGGTGDDGVLGDDGLILDSRNSATYGEPLYGIAALHPVQTNLKNNTPVDPLALNALITTPGNIQQSIINVDTELKKTFDLVPLPFDAPDTPSAHTNDDIIYGGLGNDSLHGGTGDDAISGAEALPLSAGSQNGHLVLFDFTHPYQSSYLINGQSTQYDPTAGDILGYDQGPAAKKDVNRRFLFYDGINADAREKIMLGADGNRVLDLTTALKFEYLLNFEAFTGDGIASLTLNGNTITGISYVKGTPLPITTTEKQFEIDNLVKDGNDEIFGDNGNDWLVGGTSLDRLYGGSGDDLLNIDDNLETNGGLNDIPDGTYYNINSKVQGYDGSAFSGVNLDKRLGGKTVGADIAYGGAGLDVLMDNTGADRMIDWVGEFNSYITPYAPFGEFSVSRTVQPQLPEYLYALSASDGADPSRAFDAAAPNGVAYPPGFDPARNGEPFGEIALVLQRDTFPNANWHDQVGPPRDQQAGNLPGGHRDVMAANDFANPIDPPFAPVSGTWTQANGVYQGATVNYGDAVSLFYANVQLPNYYEVLADVNLSKPTGGVKSNGFIVFDYYSPTDFKFAGIDGSTNKLEIGERTDSGWNIYTQSNMTFNNNNNTYYNLTLAVNGTQATLVVNGTNSLSYTFAPRVINGVSTNLNTGFVGVATNDAVTRFDNVIVQKLAPVTVFQMSEDFANSAGMFGAQQGTWAVSGGRYTGTPGSDAALSTMGLVVDPASLVLFQTTVNTGKTAGSMAGIVFDYYTPQDFKFAAISPATGQVIIGHRTAYGWFNDAVVKQSLTAGVDYTLGITLTGATVNVSLNGSQVATYTYDRYLNFGTVGVFSKGAKSSFDNALVKGDDSNYKVVQNLVAADGPAQTGGDLPLLSYADLLPIAQEAFQLWANSLPTSGSQVALNTLNKVEFKIADLPDNILGQTIGNTVIIDVDAAGYGWFIDRTPAANEEFSRPTPTGELFATPASPAFGEMDLLTAVMHELGHALGLEHLSQGVMEPALYTGERLIQGSYPDNGGAPAPVASAPVNEAIQAETAAKKQAWVFDELSGAFFGDGIKHSLGGNSDLKFDLTKWDGAGSSQDDPGSDWVILKRRN